MENIKAYAHSFNTHAKQKVFVAKTERKKKSKVFRKISLLLIY